MRSRFDPEADSLLNRNESAVYQRVADNLVGVEKSWGRTCRSSWAARSPVVALTRNAIEAARFVRARRRTTRGISNTLSAVTDIARRTCRAQHGGDRARTGDGFASASNHRDRVGETNCERRRRNREALQARQQQQTAD